ncbi:MAG: DJ-1/PfpI family protein, partial [Endomicrobium sp.]|nr:DJ-1/PfpI family protein [Endomicrobium sp.]
MKTAVFIVAPEGFRDEEYYKPKKILEGDGVKVVTASLKTGEIQGRFGYKALSNILVSDVKEKDYDAIVYVGGGGAKVYFDNADALRLANEFYNLGKPVTAICIAPVILANSGILKGKKATVFYPDGVEDLKKAAADYTGNLVEVDGNVITANHADAAELFGSAILKT